MFYLEETAEEFLTNMNFLNEMSLTLKEYKRRLEFLRCQIVENWCLCKWCQLYDPKCSIFNHWSNELKAYIKSLKFLKVKAGDKRKATEQTIELCDLNVESMIALIIKSKFNTENIMNEKERFYVCKAFVNNIDYLVDVLTDDDYIIDEYMYEMFN